METSADLKVTAENSYLIFVYGADHHSGVDYDGDDDDDGGGGDV